MRDPQPESAPDTTEPDGTPVENPSGTTGDGHGTAPDDVNPDLALVDPTGGDAA